MSTVPTRSDVYGIASLANPAYVSMPKTGDPEMDFVRGDEPKSVATGQSATSSSDMEALLAERIKELEQRTGPGVITGPIPVTQEPEPVQEPYCATPTAPITTAEFTPPRAPALPSEEIYRTDEMRKRACLTEAIGATDATEVLGKARSIDNKISAIEEIKDLVELFEKDGEDVRSIRIPSVDDSDDVIFNTLCILRKHNDRRRFGSLADDCIMLAATSLEALCDGQREWLGFTPDLTGWSNHVRTKLRRMRHDTSQIASVIMNDYNIGPGLRLIIELLPNMIMYARGRAAGHDAQVTDAQHGASIDRLRSV